MEGRRYEFVIVGSGAGGATLARELSRKGKDVLVVELGRREAKIGTARDIFRLYALTKLGTAARSKEGVTLVRAITAGGTTVVSCGCAVRCLEEELSDLGITMDEEFAEAEREMGVAPVAEGLLSEGSQRLRWAAGELGYTMALMPKFIDPVRCQKCGQCILGCAHGAKWTALDYLDEAQRDGADVLFDTRVEQVAMDNGRVKGVRGVGGQGPVDIQADVVVLAAGGLGTPVILQHSGLEEAGSGLTVDLLVDTYGVTDGLNQIHEPEMALIDDAFRESKGFFLSPFVHHTRVGRFAEMGVRGTALPTRRLIGILTKTADDRVGRVFPDGTVSKPVTEADWARLREGSSIAAEILVKAGADRDSIVVSNPSGCHPAGTAAIGEVVDEDLQTQVDGLFVCDASVLPTAPGLPPILTICALAKRLAKTLAP